MAILAKSPLQERFLISRDFQVVELELKINKQKSLEVLHRNNFHSIKTLVARHKSCFLLFMSQKIQPFLLK